MDKRGLAIETAHILDGTAGIHAKTRHIGTISVTDVTITEQLQKQAGRSAGRYITLEGEAEAQGMTAMVMRSLMQIIPASGRLLAVGLGNPDITHDALGARVVRSLTARSGHRYSLCAIETDVATRTGIESARQARAIAREMRADCVVVFDALSCEEPYRIGKTVQLTDAGLIPGSGAELARTGLTRATLGVPVVAVGVPTITPLSSLTSREEDKLFHITTSDINTLVEMWVEVIAGAVEYLIK